MSISSFHTDYLRNMTRWTTCTDVLEGEDRIKEKCETYLPKPTGMDDAEYSAYKTRAPFIDFTARAKDAMVGLVGRHKPVLRAPDKIVEYSEDITTTGMSLDSFSLNSLNDLLRTGRGGILVEYPAVEQSDLSVQDIESMGLRPYFAYYAAEDIIDWREGMVRGKKVLTYVKLREYFEDQDEDQDPYTVKYVQRVRILRLDSEGYCIFELFDNQDAISNGETKSYETSWVAISAFDDHRIYAQGKPIDYIPFVPLGPLSLSIAVQRPPLLGMAWLNIHHYQKGADRSHAVHWADVPTPVIIGQLAQNPDGSIPTSIKLGPTSAINILSQSGDAKFLEMLGNGIVPTATYMKELQDQMALLGNKILASDASSNQAAEAMSIQRTGEQAILATMANVLSEGITRALYMLADRAGIPGTIVYKLSTDYLPNPMDSQTLIALIKAVIAGKMSDQEFFEALVAGEVVRSDKTFEEHKKEIEATPQPSVEEKQKQTSKEMASVGISGSELDVASSDKA